MLHTVEALITDANALLEITGTHEGVKSTPWTKVEAAESRLRAKLEKDDALEIMVAHNTRTTDENVEENLHDTGSELLKNATVLLEKLGLQKALMESVQCRDEQELEYSPEYLLRSIKSARQAGMSVPSVCYSTLMQRQCVSILEDGNLGKAVSNINPDMHNDYGLSLMNGIFPPMAVWLAQEDVGVTILQWILGADPFEKPKLRSALAQLLDVVHLKSAKAALNDLVMLLEPEAFTEDEVNSALKNYSAINGSHSEKYIQLLQTQVGKDLVAAAKKGCLQRIVDQCWRKPTRR